METMITQFPADSSDAKSVAGHPIVVPAPVQPGDDAETVADRPSIVQSPVQPGYDAETVTDRPLIVPALVQPGDDAETVANRLSIVPVLAQPYNNNAITILSSAIPTTTEFSTGVPMTLVWITVPDAEQTMFASSIPTSATLSDIAETADNISHSTAVPPCPASSSKESDVEATDVPDMLESSSESYKLSSGGSESGDTDNFDVPTISLQEEHSDANDQKCVNVSVKGGVKCRRSKKICPVKHCGAEVIHLPRHLRETHKWHKEHARTAIQHYSLRKTYTYSNSYSSLSAHRKDSHKHRRCPVAGCLSIVKRLPPHLMQHHRISRNSEQFTQLCKTARKRARQVQERPSTEGECVDSIHLQKVGGLHTDDNASVCSEGNGNSCAEKTLDSQLDIDDSFCRPNNNDVDDDSDKFFYEVNYNNDCESGEINETSCSECSDFDDFKKWLQSPDGGLKTEKCALQHAFQVQRIAAVTTGNPTISVLTDRKSVKEKFLLSYVAEKQLLPGTVKSYLTSLRHWCSYILSERIAETTEAKQAVQSMFQTAGHWISSYRRDTLKRHLKKHDDDIGKLISAEDVASFDRSAVALEAVKLIATAQTHTVAMSQQQYTHVRDFLMVNVAIANANRSGVLSEMTVEQLKHASKMDDNYIISVSEHKTAIIYGPAKVIVSSTLYSWLMAFVNDVRQRCVILAGDQQATNCLFVSWNGEQLSSGQVTRCIQNIWSRAGLGKITCTLIRKAAVSAIHQQCPDQKANLADLMCHNVSTASKYYRQVDRNRTSTEAAKHLSSVMRPAKLAVDVHSESDDVHDKTTSASEPFTHVQGRFSWNDELRNVLLSVFRDEISSKSVSVGEVSSKIKGNKILAAIGCRRVYDKLRREMLQKCSGDVGESDVPVCLPVEKETLQAKVARMAENDQNDDDVPPTSINSGLQKLFKANELEVIQAQCRHIIASGPISCERITKALEQSTSGATLLRKYSIDQIISRVKYERRKIVLCLRK